MTFIPATYPWPFDGNLGRLNTALLVIDMQVDFCASGGWVDQQYLPEQRRYYEPTDRGHEAAIRQRLDELRSRKAAQDAPGGG